MTKPAQKQDTASYVIGVTQNLVRHKTAYKQMFREALEKGKNYKAEKEALEAELKLVRSSSSFSADDLTFLENIIFNGHLSEDEEEVAAYEKENPQHFEQQEQQLKKKKQKNNKK